MNMEQLKRKANQLRAEVLKMVTNANSGHPGGALGMADILAVLHYEYIDDRPGDPDWEGRDRFLLSNGHTCPILYAILADKGYFPKEELKHLRKLGALLQGHPSTARGTPGVELSSGSLGHGLSVASGVALAGRLDGRNYKTFCSISDAECQEGQTWEAAAVANDKSLGNLCAIVDYNDSQIDGKVHQVMDVKPLSDKWNSFGWRVFEIDGHNYQEIRQSLDKFSTKSSPAGQPTVIISHNVLGKGVSFMEDDHTWHHGVLSEEQLKQAVRELGERGLPDSQLDLSDKLFS
ncbi:MAG: transketolase [Candidatus Acetothermia bacterium]